MKRIVSRDKVQGARRWLRGPCREPRTSNLEPDSGLTLVELIICVTIRQHSGLRRAAGGALPGQAPAGARTAPRPVGDARRHRQVQGRRRPRRHPGQGGQHGLSARPADPGGRSGRQGQEGAVPARHPGRPHDQIHRLGPALQPGRRRLRLLGQPERLRRLHQERRHRARRDKVQAHGKPRHNSAPAPRPPGSRSKVQGPGRCLPDACHPRTSNLAPRPSTPASR